VEEKRSQEIFLGRTIGTNYWPSQSFFGNFIIPNNGGHAIQVPHNN
jgi:hypothetical protein